MERPLGHFTYPKIVFQHLAFSSSCDGELVESHNFCGTSDKIVPQNNFPERAI